MNRQDRQGVRSAQDLERKYDLKSIGEMKKAIETQDNSLIKTNKILNDFVKKTLETMLALQEQVDGKVETWFYNGEPTLENVPASEWDTEELKLKHCGDLYYDKDTGKAYRFASENDEYKWQPLIDKDIATSLELVSKAQDTADNKRRVFTKTPTLPYDVGDLWVQGSNGDIFVCKTSRTEGEYTESDWVKASKYTDNSELDTFIQNDYVNDLKKINQQIDKKAETWYQSTEPSTEWTTEEVRKLHIGDLWYNTTNSKNYIYNSSYEWEEINGVPSSVYDTIGGKAQIFTSIPTTPYSIGDMWIKDREIYICQAPKTKGETFDEKDFVIATKYTDNTELKDFIDNVYKTAMDSLVETINAKITTWYYSGEPTLENEPTVNWQDEEKIKHIGDLYYDKDTGYVYRFENVNDSYGWTKIVNQDLTKALAMASASKDTADSKRRIFTVQPSPPYDNGDLWLKDQEIYVCQISKEETEEYAEHDFIIATKYTDDTLAKQNGEKLEVLEGTVLTVVADAEQLRFDLTDLDKNTTDAIELIKGAFSSLITDEHGQSMMKQTSDGWVFEMKRIIESLQSNSEKVGDLETSVSEAKTDAEKTDLLVRQLIEKTTYISMGETEDGEACIVLGSQDSDFKLVITQTQILFMEGSETPAYMTNKTMVITKAYIKDQMQIGTMAWVKRANGHISFMGVS